MLQAINIQALTTALQHPAVALEPHDPCNLLQTCHSWRSAIKQSAAGSVTIDVDVCRKLRQLPAFAKFAAWMHDYAGLVHAIKLRTPGAAWHGMTPIDYCSAVEATLIEALASRASILHLRAFSTDYLQHATVIEALPAHSLTKLSLQLFGGSCGPKSIPFANALAKLTGLQQLRVSCRADAKVSKGVSQHLAMVWSYEPVVRARRAICTQLRYCSFYKGCWHLCSNQSAKAALTAPSL